MEIFLALAGGNILKIVLKWQLKMCFGPKVDFGLADPIFVTMHNVYRKLDMAVCIRKYTC